jgi:hypothetical protein
MINVGRQGLSPQDILEKLLATDPEFAKAAEERGSLVPLPPLKPLAALVRHPEGRDPNELIRRRFLCRGGSAVLVGPTGVGKSSLVMQAAILWALGRPAFGLEPARPLRILIIQAENDEGDIAEMRDGVLAGLGLSEEERRLACANVVIVHEDTKVREKFADLLDRLLEHQAFDLVIADPAFAYVGGDASAQREVSPFLRNMLNPVIHRHRVGFLLVHHVNKPPSGEQKPQWQAGDYAYLGSGSAEFANWARAVIAIRSIGSETVYELILAKRGRRAGWLDDNGRPTTVRHIASHREPGVICWREPDTDEVADLMGDGRPTVRDVVDAFRGREVWKKDLAQELEGSTGLKAKAVYNLIAAAIKAGAVRIVRTGPRGSQLLRSTDKIQPRPSVADQPEENHDDTP